MMAELKALFTPPLDAAPSFTIDDVYAMIGKLETDAVWPTMPVFDGAYGRYFEKLGVPIVVAPYRPLPPAPIVTSVF